MHVITRSCVLLFWMQTLTFVKSQEHLPDCTLHDFLNGPLFDSNFDTTGLEARYVGGKQITVSCSTGYSGFFQLLCIEGEWQSRGTICKPPVGCERPPPLENGDTKNSMKFSYRHNDQVEYICQAYHVMQGGPFETCNDGEWTREIRCLKPCTVDEEAMRRHNIMFRYSGKDKMYSAHDDVIEFRCTRGRTVGSVGMRQKCVDGVLHLPTCR